MCHPINYPVTMRSVLAYPKTMYIGFQPLLADSRLPKLGWGNRLMNINLGHCKGIPEHNRTLMGIGNLPVGKTALKWFGNQQVKLTDS